jgi:N-acetylglucosamine-6-sulfatase
MTKRTLLTTLSALVVTSLLAAADPGPRRPNVIVIVTDDQRWDALGVVQREQGSAARFSFFETPHLDRLAREGARFRNAFVTHSLCSPSRASMLTGLQTSGHGIRDNRTPFRPERTWARALGEAGYRTGYFGKWHMGRQEDRPGFAETFTFVDQGEYANCRFLENGTWVESAGWVDDVTTDRAIAFVTARRAEPFAIVVGYKTPHDPRQPPPRHVERYAGVEIAPPANLHARPTFPAPPERPWNPRVADRLNYFRCLQGVDDNVGRLLDALAAIGAAEDTVVIFTSDNGYYLGEHGLGDKRTAYDESLRIPLLVRYPRTVAAGLRVDELVLNTDIAGTVLELAGVRGDWRQDGRSLVPLLRGEPPAEWRTEFFYENFQDPEWANVTFDVEALRTAEAKLVVFPGRPEWTQAFDLKSDPLEMRNLAAEPAAAEWLEALRRRFDAARAALRRETP